MNEFYEVVEERIKDISSETISNSKFKLNKEKTKLIIIASKPKTNHVKLTKEDIENIKKKPIGNELLKLRKKICKKFKGENLNLLNRNIKTVKIKIKYFAPEILLLKFASGKYSLQKNRIKLINLLKEGSTSHEFLHMATSFYDPKVKTGFSGFQQSFYFLNKGIGYGLNEGYTELLNKRYFKEEIKSRNYSYDICTFFALKLEEIVEKDRMESFYMTADLFGLYNYLLNFDNSENVLNFIKIIDSLLIKVSLFNLKKYEKHYELIECYLAKWYMVKKKQELDNNIIDKNIYDIEIKKYIDSLNNKELNLKNYVNKKEYCLK